MENNFLPLKKGERKIRWREMERQREDKVEAKRVIDYVLLWLL